MDCSEAQITPLSKVFDQDGSHDTFDISGFINDDWGVTCTNTNGWFTRTVGCFNHARTTGCKDKVDVWVMHQLVRQFYTWLVNPTNNVFWRTRCNRGLQHNVCGFVGGVFSTWVRGEDNTVPGFQTDKCFENRRRSWVGGWDDTANDADRFSDGDGTEGVIL